MEMNNDNILRLRGLPYDSTTDDVQQFFDGITINPTCIKIPTDDMGRSSGEAFVQFNCTEDVQEAMKKNRENMGWRYIEIFPSTSREAHSGKPLVPKASNLGKKGRAGPYQRSPSYGRGFGMNMEHMSGSQMSGSQMSGSRMSGSQIRSPSYGRGFGRDMKGFSPRQSFNPEGMGNLPQGMGEIGGHAIRMRGLPFSATEMEVAEWFSSVADPFHVSIEYNKEGKPSGDASVFFRTAQEAKNAMSKNKQYMAHRYVELFEENPSPGEWDMQQPIGFGMGRQIMMGGGMKSMGMSGNTLMAGMGMSGVGFNQSEMAMGGSGLDINQMNSMAKLPSQAFNSFALGGF